MLSLDHIVFAGKDIETARKEYGNIALKSIKGGEHDHWGTYNYLAYFSNSCYIEWLGVRDLEKAEQSDNPLIQHLVHTLSTEKQGAFQFALRTTKLDAYVDHFIEKKIPFTGPIHGERVKQDGSTLRWRMLFPTYNMTTETLPFLIEWNQPEAERFDISLINSQALTKIKFAGMDQERFQAIYQLRPRARNRTFRLTNASIEIVHDGKLQMIIE